MGKFSRVTGQDVKSPLAGYNPYEASLKQIDKIQKETGQVVPGTPIVPGTVPSTPAGEAPGVEAVPQGQPSVAPQPQPQQRSPVQQPGAETVIPESREELKALTQQEINPETGVQYTPEEAETRVSAELETQQESGLQNIDLGFETDSQLLATADLEGVSKDQASAVVTNGAVIGQAINETINPTLFDPNNASSVEFLAKNGLINQEGKVDTRLGNAIAIALPAMIREDVIKRENVEDKLSASQEAFGRGDTELDVAPSFDPNLTQGNLVSEVLKVVNPQQSDDGFYQKDTQNNLTKDPGAAGIEAGLWKALHDKGYLEEYTPEGGNKRYRWSPRAVEYYNGTRDIMKKINPKQRIEPSATPAFGGRTFGKEVLSKSAKTISVKAKADKNQEVETAVKDTLGRMPIKINQGRLALIAQLYKEVTSQLDPEKGFSTHPLANVFRIGEARWQGFRDKAFLRQIPGQEKTPEFLDKEATRIMNDQISQIEIDINDASNTQGSAFYNKWFHAAANGRYHILNTVLNSQNSKLARSLVENAVDVKIVPAKAGGDKTRHEKNARYIIARNLRKDINVEDVGWNATVKDFDKLLPEWANIGKQIVESGTLPPAVKESLSKDKDAHETWGNTVQSYIDAYNYQQAKTNGTTFTPKAHTQHDGKQNGLAIQALQGGDFDLMEKAGLIYKDEDESVIPNGDIRAAFITNLDGATKVAFSGSPETAAAFNSAISRLTPGERKKLAKGPLMETAYGKWHEYHKETAYKFVKEHSGFADSIMKQTGMTELEVVLGLNQVISNGLKTTLNLDHQQKLKRVGDLWGALGTTPVIQGPLGNYIFFGSKAFNADIDPDTGLPKKTVFQTATGPVERTLGTVGPTTAGQPIAKTVIGATGEASKATQRVGAIIPNQMPVLTVQHIDAAVMADTILRVNADKTGTPYHMLPVHDALITDASSVDKYHAQVNKSFVDINKGYNIAEQVERGLLDAIGQWKSKVKDDTNYNVHPDFGEYRALYHLIDEVYNRTQQAKTEGQRPSESNLELLKHARRIGIQPLAERSYKGQVNYVKGSDLKFLMTILSRKLGSQRGLKTWKDAIKTNQSKHWSKINELVYQYN